jgi:hypothetical protein
MKALQRNSARPWNDDFDQRGGTREESMKTPSATNLRQIKHIEQIRAWFATTLRIPQRYAVPRRFPQQPADDGDATMRSGRPTNFLVQRACWLS